MNYASVGDVSDGRAPTATYVLISYNQEAYIAAAVGSALAQTYEPLRILISDDASTDGTFDIIRDLVAKYSGPHHVEIVRNPKNLGTNKHLNQILKAVSGDVMIIAAGDDISLPHRASRIIKEFQSHPMALMVHSCVISMSETEILNGKMIPPIVSKKMKLARIAISGSLHFGASAAYHIKLIEKFGLLPDTRAFEDLIFGFRAALLDAISYVDEPLLYYRSGGASSQNAFQSFEAYKESRLNEIEISLAVLEQRMLDCKLLKNLKIKKIIQARHRKFTLQKIYIENKLNFFRFLFSCQIIKAFQAGWTERKAYRKNQMCLKSIRRI